MRKHDDLDNGRLMCSPIALIIPWALTRHLYEKWFGTHGFHSIEVRESETTKTWRAHPISYKHAVSLLKCDEGRTLRGLVTPLLPFGFLYLLGRLTARRQITRLSGGERMADYRLFRLDRDYLLSYSTEPMVSFGGGCMALSEMLILAREGERARREAERALARAAA